MSVALPEGTGNAAWLAATRSRVEARLAALLPAPAGSHDAVAAAMQAAVLGGGKRLRPLLTLSVGEALGCRAAGLLDLACAVEFVHCASLVLDDMPAMDNALMRRGQPTVHLRFGEDVAMLATVALVTEALRIVAAAPGLPAAACANAVQVLCTAIGPAGLVRGQYRDLHEGGAPRSVAAAAEANAQKTGVLFVAALELGALAAGAIPAVADLRRAALSLGQAFQLRDDLEDLLPGDIATGEDAGKSTLTQILGAAGARSMLQAELQDSRQALRRALGGECGVVDLLLERAFADFSRAQARPGPARVASALPAAAS
ncbi:MAG TPA: polyprenyl synthetase family protein [Ramlibacter sp.]|jgi:geranylgeranyl diphosphate synthase type II|nr:polyprenyl synthetase family protein [Ramlibacter sp.]